MKLTEVLDRPERWCQHKTYWANGDGAVQAVCLQGAVAVVVGGLAFGRTPVHAFTPMMLRRNAALMEQLAAVIVERDPRMAAADADMIVATWNDQRTTTFADVHAVCAETDRRAEIDRQMMLEDAP